MAKLKTRKALSKRFKITRTGKVLRRPIGQDHYLSKQSGKARRNKKGWKELGPSEAKTIKKALFS
ncbi:50S ribosomal protein L35 [Patescibacteria group bacterium]|nr:50S ribosomal protein L35 [Patescibacteria group bacterium]